MGCGFCVVVAAADEEAAAWRCCAPTTRRQSASATPSRGHRGVTRPGSGVSSSVRTSETDSHPGAQAGSQIVPVRARDRLQLPVPRQRPELCLDDRHGLLGEDLQLPRRAAAEAADRARAAPGLPHSPASPRRPAPRRAAAGCRARRCPRRRGALPSSRDEDGRREADPLPALGAACTAPASRASSGGPRTSSRSAPNASVIACERRSISKRGAVDRRARPAAAISASGVIELAALEHDPLAQARAGSGSRPPSPARRPP